MTHLQSLETHGVWKQRRDGLVGYSIFQPPRLEPFILLFMSSRPKPAHLCITPYERSEELDRKGILKSILSSLPNLHLRHTRIRQEHRSEETSSQRREKDRLRRLGHAQNTTLGMGCFWKMCSLFVMAGEGRLGPRKEQWAMPLNVREQLESLLCSAEIPQPVSSLYTWVCMRCWNRWP